MNIGKNNNLNIKKSKKVQMLLRWHGPNFKFNISELQLMCGKALEQKQNQCDKVLFFCL